TNGQREAERNLRIRDRDREGWSGLCLRLTFLAFLYYPGRGGGASDASCRSCQRRKRNPFTPVRWTTADSRRVTPPVFRYPMLSIVTTNGRPKLSPRFALPGMRLARSAAFVSARRCTISWTAAASSPRTACNTNGPAVSKFVGIPP